MNEKRIKYFLSITLIAIVSIYVIIYGVHKFNGQESLDSLCSAWRNNPSERVSISKDLVNRKDMIGLDTNKVIELLGKPSEIDTEESLIIYSCRKNGLLSSYTLFLNIKFDQNNKVVSLDTFLIDD